MRFIYLLLALAITFSIVYFSFNEDTFFKIAAGILAGVFFSKFYYMGKLVKLKAFERKFEKLSVQGESESSKVVNLEAKIKTLEIALEKALSNSED